MQWRAIRGAGPDDDAKAAAFRQHWSLKEVCSTTLGALTSTSIDKHGRRQHTNRWGVPHILEAWAPSFCIAGAQALVKVRGDGLEFDMGRAEMQVLPAPGAGATSARLKIDGIEQPRCALGALAQAGVCRLKARRLQHHGHAWGNHMMQASHTSDALVVCCVGGASSCMSYEMAIGCQWRGARRRSSSMPGGWVKCTIVRLRKLDIPVARETTALRASTCSLFVEMVLSVICAGLHQNLAAT